ncbi:phosphoribosyltransferase [Marinobacter vinifirmus]|uniref:Phosphoribosyltransferase n=1 Tax=Marinobacter vinifirmus TaxID=355591 RepID=A0A558B379_9GAMM|nr:phosphoribosyltransferase [Marinobacter vinifirmus]TVT30970.1 MAG: phosphoribosyltransferase [Marinobacter vinifirmus]
MDRVYSFPKDAKHYHCFVSDTDIKQHADYRSAKSGNADSALKLISDLALDFLVSLKGEFPSNSIFVSPYAKEATGDNALPVMLSLLCAELLIGNSETDIVQMQRVFHTGADPMERLIARPSFEGAVQHGGQYVLVDDVSSMGSTLAELANYLLLNGGKVVGTLLLVNAGRSKEFRALKKHVRLLEARFGDEIKNIFGIHIPALTANEASYLVGFRTADEIRNRCAKAEKETAKRLLSKGYTGSAGQ